MDLSVIIPCRNEASTLGQQLDALARQQWAGEWEVIVVDNGSTDGTAEIAAAHPGLKDRLRVVKADGGSGVAFARRCGVDVSSARSVAFCDGDDVVADGWIAALGEALEQHDFVTGDIDLERLNDPGLAASRGPHRPGLPPLFGSIIFLRGNNHGMTRAGWETLGGFDEAFPGLEDIEASLRAASKGLTITFVPGALVHYRYRHDSRALRRQGRYYGASHVMLVRRCRELGLEPPRPHAWKSWAWLVLRLPTAWLPTRRPAWLWVLACRLGALREQCRH